MITGTMSVNITLEKANYLNALERRDKAMPATRCKGEKGYYKCPVCEEVLGNEERFCKACGQRIDTKNEAL